MQYLNTGRRIRQILQYLQFTLAIQFIDSRLRPDQFNHPLRVDIGLIVKDYAATIGADVDLADAQR